MCYYTKNKYNSSKIFPFQSRYFFKYQLTQIWTYSFFLVLLGLSSVSFYYQRALIFPEPQLLIIWWTLPILQLINLNVLFFDFVFNPRCQSSLFFYFCFANLQLIYKTCKYFFIKICLKLTFRIKFAST